MVGSAIASSLIHEVGHQGAAQLGLVDSLRTDITRAAARDPDGVWPTWHKWISEIVADCWSVGKLGITSTLGLFAVVSLPTFFVFRPSGNDPHPVPYLRVLISASLGEAIYPHPQWTALRQTWKQLYPVAALPPGRQDELRRVEAAIPDLVGLLLGHRPPALGGRRLGDLWPSRDRHPTRLTGLHRTWGGDIAVMARQPPSLVFAVLGQAKAAGLLTPEEESALLSTLLSAWAVRSSLDIPRNPIHTAPPVRWTPSTHNRDPVHSGT